jgi:hypothetical protein
MPFGSTFLAVTAPASDKFNRSISHTTASLIPRVCGIAPTDPHTQRGEIAVLEHLLRESSSNRCTHIDLIHNVITVGGESVAGYRP